MIAEETVEHAVLNDDCPEVGILGGGLKWRVFSILILENIVCVTYWSVCVFLA